LTSWSGLLRTLRARLGQRPDLAVRLLDSDGCETKELEALETAPQETLLLTAAPLGPQRRALISAADALFFPSLCNLIGSLHYWEPHLRIIIYDLGMTAEQRSGLVTLCNVELRSFKWERYPPHIHPRFRNYAWKACLILEALREEVSTLLFYQDAGQEARAPLAAVYEAIERDGFFFTTSGMHFPNTRWNHPSSFRYWNVSTEAAEWLPLRAEIIGGILGFRRGAPSQRWLEQWVACGLEEHCVSPAETDRTNHRQARPSGLPSLPYALSMH